ncbi:FeoB small GTPase domain-containing protein [Anaeromicrobium sp.]|jgi:ferrous iron transport protein B|uniref:FeoB small GTPase domain-containing protein n=1 Tax=Anaeromicrobium sp. TaxID=1929132 RepID=UPI002ED2B0BF
MGLTRESTGHNLLEDQFNIHFSNNDGFIIALAGNPNVGKSTVFNALTGLNQHTGNWPGKTVSNARGIYSYENTSFTLVDLPGTYSLMSNSAEEEIARDFICFGKPDVTVIVADATCLERNLNLTLQINELTDNVILCLNLMDEAFRKGINIDIKSLEKSLGIPVVPTTASKGEGLGDLKKTILSLCKGTIKSNPVSVVYTKEVEDAICELLPEVQKMVGDLLNPRWVSLKVLEGDKKILDSIMNFLLLHCENYKEVSCSG